ncbi:RidA family protein [Arthrobacter sp. I2-34]|uniref:RidA family protein n=1 Tax=Arthrobacter hankyongi TaxID=2904801 RepID=A0ABS9L3T6_9MICC|nr:RidA family protein [Arthrobacter hankyongi]MCG2621345.1 RidA family protein [Arthrobacter hankyongi]
MKRRSVTVPGLEHGSNPVPAASRLGPLLATGGVRGVDTATGQLPPAAEDQVRLAFVNLRTIIEEGGGRAEDIVHVTVFAAAEGLRPVLNEEWVAMFPDVASRPARHLLRQDLPGGMLVQLEAMAYITEGE